MKPVELIPGADVVHRLNMELGYLQPIHVHRLEHRNQVVHGSDGSAHIISDLRKLNPIRWPR